MRSDQNLPKQEFRASNQWQFDHLLGESKPEIDRRYSEGKVENEDGRRWHSFSGHEQNHLFMNQGGETFVDYSLTSGMNNVADGRSFAIWDFNRDGWSDVVLANANRPLLNVYRNELSSQPGNERKRFIAIRLIGGNSAAKPSRKLSNRDAYGAKIQIVSGNLRLVREVRCGEGFAAQNSKTITVGIGVRDRVDRMTIHWPSGRRSSAGPFNANGLVTVFENVADSMSENGFEVSDYSPIQIRGLARTSMENDDSSSQVEVLKIATRPNLVRSEYRLFTTMATWCEACRSHLPQWKHLRESIPPETLSIHGVPADSLESKSELDQYMHTYRPAYGLVIANPDELTQMMAVLRRTIQSDAIPATIITDSKGDVVKAFLGVPTVSQIWRVLRSSPGENLRPLTPDNQ